MKSRNLKSSVLESKLSPLLTYARYKGYTIDDLVGTYKLLLVLQANDEKFNHTKRPSKLNFPIQGTAFYDLLQVYLYLTANSDPEYSILVYVSEIFYIKEVNESYGRVTLKMIKNAKIIKLAKQAIDRANKYDPCNRYVSLPCIAYSLAILYAENSWIPSSLYGLELNPYWTIRVGKLLEGVTIPIAIQAIQEPIISTKDVTSYLEAIRSNFRIKSSPFTKIPSSQQKNIRKMLEEKGRFN